MMFAHRSLSLANHGFRRRLRARSANRPYLRRRGAQLAVAQGIRGQKSLKNSRWPVDEKAWTDIVASLDETRSFPKLIL